MADPAPDEMAENASVANSGMLSATLAALYPRWHGPAERFTVVEYEDEWSESQTIYFYILDASVGRWTDDCFTDYRDEADDLARAYNRGSKTPRYE